MTYRIGPSFGLTDVKLVRLDEQGQPVGKPQLLPPVQLIRPTVEGGFPAFEWQYELIGKTDLRRVKRLFGLPVHSRKVMHNIERRIRRRIRKGHFRANVTAVNPVSHTLYIDLWSIR